MFPSVRREDKYLRMLVERIERKFQEIKIIKKKKKDNFVLLIIKSGDTLASICGNIY